MNNSIFEALTLSEEDVIDQILADLQWDEALSQDVQSYGVDLVSRIRAARRKGGSLESFFQEYDLTTKEGLALMSLGEALLRIPDTQNANALIKDKISGTNWLKSSGKGSKNWMTKAAGLGLKISSGTMNSLLSKIGEPFIRQAMMKAMTLLGKQFVVGEDLQLAMKNAKKWEQKGFVFSYDILGEGARTAAQAEIYFLSYQNALRDIVKAKQDNPKITASISVKLSALHPRFEYAQNDRCIPEITDKLMTLCLEAAANDIALTVDAEEMSRLHPWLEIIKNVCDNNYLRGWDGFGVAVQAYHKGAPELIEELIALSKLSARKMRVRLVKGAYWDTEIRHAQLEGLSDYPVFTRKSNTDVSYLRCAQKMLRNRAYLYPMFGTHNAHTVAAIIQMTKNDITGFEFQKLFGMGDALFTHLMHDHDVTVTMYAPVGPYKELLPYLVRRMLENGANSSFVNQLYDTDLSPEDLVQDPVLKVRCNNPQHHPNIPLPVDIYQPKRLNSKGLDFDNPVMIEPAVKRISQYNQKQYEATPIVNGKTWQAGQKYPIISPADTLDKVGDVTYTRIESIDKIFEQAKKGHKTWKTTDVEKRARTLENIATLLDYHRDELMALCVREAGRTLKDASDEIREAIDFCYYYAMLARNDFKTDGHSLPSPTGETNIYSLQGRGVFVCISPWNFPIAIYLGQIMAALVAGNSVIAKPAEQTPLIGCFLAQLIHKAGVPVNAFHFAPGGADVGAMLVAHKEVAGVAFTGSTGVAKFINQTLANGHGAIPKLIAETGGQNAMIIDSSALTEQVIDDVVQSAFGSAGQRCSACRILYVQSDVYEKTTEMLKGAMAEISISHSFDLSSDLGPLISEDAYRNVQSHKTKLSGFSKEIAQAGLPKDVKRQGHYFAPMACQLKDVHALEGEVFGPILHVVPYDLNDIEHVIEDINAMGYGLTFGIHSRIQSFIDKVTSEIECGNLYVNRGTIGAVVGVQPFGGHGLSGTGPKAGGPLYLHGFAVEKVISTDITAAGGNASLVMLND